MLSEHLARFVLKERRPPGYYLPRELDDNLVDQLTSPHLVKRLLPDGRSEHVWEFTCDPHLFDCEKEGEVLGYVLSVELLQQLRAKQDEVREKLRHELAKRNAGSGNRPAGPDCYILS